MIQSISYNFLFLFQVEVLLFFTYIIIKIKNQRAAKGITDEKIIKSIVAKQIFFNNKLLHYLYLYTIVIKPFYLLIITNGFLYLQMDTHITHIDNLVPSNHVEDNISISSQKSGELSEVFKNFAKIYDIPLEKPKDIDINIEPTMAEIQRQRHRDIFFNGVCHIDHYNNVILRDFPLRIMKPLPFANIQEFVMWKACMNIPLTNPYENNVFGDQTGVGEHFLLRTDNYNFQLAEYTLELRRKGIIR